MRTSSSQSRKSLDGSLKVTFVAKGLLLLSCILCFSAAGQAATVTGTVTVADGEPFRAAFVEAQNLKTHITVIVLSDNNGRYRIENLPSGQYDVSIKALGFKAEPRKGIDLTTQQAATAQFTLQKSVVLWSDLSIYQGEVLLPNLPGKRVLLTDGTTPIRDSPCQICHSSQNKMAPAVRDAAGWRNRVDFMKNTIRCCNGDTGVSEKDEDDLVSYLTLLFGPNSIDRKSVV
jgi:hypothetical protein